MSNEGDQRTPTATRLGSYEIVCKLAEGGMAELFLARTIGPLGFEKLVVLKKILPHFAANPRFVQLFLEEAKLAAGLDHPHIAHVYDMGMIDGNYFFTMEYIHGQDLRAMLRRTDRRRQKFPLEHAVQVTRDVAAALHYAHERRRPDGASLDIVHRDVSPSNVLVSYDGAVKLLDFGVAKAASSSVKTRTGTLKGKVGYMSPEQAKGSPIDRRSDVFSLGVIAWEMIATRRLFKADNDLATIQRIINTPAPLARTARPDCPSELEAIVARALCPDPAARYQTAQELQVDLEEYAREHRLQQSAIALANFVVGMFETEHAAWVRAQKSGTTLSEFVASGSVADATTPVSTSGNPLADGSFEDEDEDPAAIPVAAPPVRSAPVATPLQYEIDGATEVGPPPVMIASPESASIPTVAPAAAASAAPALASTRTLIQTPPPVGSASAPPAVAAAAPAVAAAAPAVVAAMPKNAFAPEMTYQVPRPSWMRPGAIAVGALAIGVAIFLVVRGGSSGDSTSPPASSQRSEPAAGTPDDPSAKPAANPDSPTTKPDQPDDPIAKPDDPISKPDDPIAKPDDPISKPDDPIAKPDQRNAKPDAPIAKPDVAVAKPAKPDAPIAKPDVAVAKPAKPDAPIAKPDVAVAKPAKPDAPIAKPDVAVAKPAKPNKPVAKPDKPVANPDKPVAKPDVAVRPSKPVTKPPRPDKPVKPATTKPASATTKPFDADDPMPPPP